MIGPYEATITRMVKKDQEVAMAIRHGLVGFSISYQTKKIIAGVIRQFVIMFFCYNMVRYLPGDINNVIARDVQPLKTASRNLAIRMSWASVDSKG